MNSYKTSFNISLTIFNLNIVKEKEKLLDPSSI